jgi:hypothetical protein
MSEFNDIIDKKDIIEKKREKLERYIFYFVIGFVVLGIGVAYANQSVLNSMVYWLSPIGENAPNITYHEAISGNNLEFNSTDEYPTFNNSYVRFNISFTDPDAFEWHTIYVCNESMGNYTFDVVGGVPIFSCGGRFQYCRHSDNFVTDNPLYCDAYAYGYGNQTQNYSLYLLDSSGRLAYTSGTFVVNRPPRIDSIEVVIL